LFCTAYNHRRRKTRTRKNEEDDKNKANTRQTQDYKKEAGIETSKWLV